MTNTDRLRDLLAALDSLANQIESLLLDKLSAAVPWLAPVIPAHLAYANMISVLRFPDWLALVGAGVVEGLGLATVNTVFQFWEFNDSHADGRAPTRVAAAVGVGYLALVLLVNVILDDAPALHRLAKCLLSLTSVAAGITLALRSQHKRRLTQLEAQRQQVEGQTERQHQEQLEREARQQADRAQARRERLAAKVEIERIHATAAQEFANGTPMAKLAKRGTYDDFRVAQMARNGDGPMSASEIVATFGVPLRTAYNWLKKHREDLAEPERSMN